MRVGAAPFLMFVAACSFDGNAQPPGGIDGPGSPTIDSPPGTIDGPPSPIDATPSVDAAPAVTCPVNYDLSRETSRYRIPSEKAVWAAAETDCEDDTAGWSHLVALDSDGEWDWVSVTTGLLPGTEWYAIGVVRDAASPTGPWRTVTGGVAPVMHWRQTLGPDEPTNTSPGEPVVVLDSTLNLAHSPALGGFIDVRVDVPYFYVCECDGRPPVDATY